MDGPPRCAFLEIACAVRESKDPDGRAICTMAGQMDICGQMAERICGGRETLRYVSVEVMSCHHNQLEKREALREALAWSANPGRAVLCAAVSRLARVDDEAIAAIRTVTMGGGRVFFAASAASVAAAPKGALLSQLNATAASGCSGTAQTSVAWQLADFLEQRATVSPPPARLLAARATLERTIPPSTAIVTVGRVSPGAKQAARSLKRQQLGTGLVASGLRHTFYGLSGDVQGQSTTDSLNGLPLKILIDKQVKEWLKLPPEQQPKHGLVLAWGAERPTRSLTQLSELCEYCRGLSIPVSLAICAPPLPLLQGRSAKRLLQLSLADAPVKPAAAEREHLQQLLADSEGEVRLSGLLVLHLGASTLATPELASYMDAAEAFKRWGADHSHVGSASDAVIADCGKLELRCRTLSAEHKSLLLSAFGGSVGMGGEPSAPSRSPARLAKFAVQLLDRAGRPVGLGIGLGTPAAQQDRNAERKGQFWACVQGCSYRCSKANAADRFPTHFARSPECAAAVRAILHDSTHPDHALWTRHEKWLGRR
mmetsp:Transcript_6434/g.20516  ORF Transcript_6434/g.20516 Transcript_6434/m.20516 type:complete len:542 (-) Transcript_6434:413-2038(-)